MATTIKLLTDHTLLSHSTSTATQYYSIALSTMNTELNKTTNVPSNARITNVKVIVKARFEYHGWAGTMRASYRFGLGNNKSISKELLGSTNLHTSSTGDKKGEKENSATLTLSSDLSPFALSTSDGSYFTVAIQSDNVLSKSFYIDKIWLEVTYEIPTYTITWKNFDGKGGTKTTTVNRGTVPSYSGTPSKAADTKKEYTFSGWSPSIVAATGNATYTAQFTESPRTYYVFIDNPSGDCETNFITQKYKYGDTITLNAYNFAEHTEFNFWCSNNGTKDWYSNPQTVTLNEELITHCLSSSGNLGFICYTKFKTYTIKANIQPNSNAGFVQYSYYIDGVWYGGNAVTVPNEGISFTYGDSNAYAAFKATANEGYKFFKWSDGVTDNPRNIDTSRNITYTAIFEKLTFTATFKNYDGNVLQTVIVEYGGIPEYTGSTPTKSSTSEYNYYFSGWSPPLGNIATDITYTAQFTAKRKYTLTATASTGGTISGGGTYEEGTKVTLIATPKTGYYLSDWLKDGTSLGITTNPYSLTVSANVTYTAVFKKYSYTITFKDGDGKILQSSDWEYDTTPSYSGSTPTKTSTIEYTYSWNTSNPWTPAISKVTGAQTYTANFNSAKRKYLIKFVNYDNSPLESKEVEYGTKPAYTGSTPIKPSDNQYDYTFSGWTPAISNVTGTTTYKATFTSALRTFTISVTDGVISIISGNLVDGKYTYGSKIKITANEKTGYKFINWSGSSSSTQKEIEHTVTSNASFVANYRRLQMKFKSVKILHHSTNETASPTNPLIGGEDGDQAIIKVEIALE